MNLGIEDAAAFARRFVEHRLDGYTAERHPVARRWIETSERVLRLVQTGNPAAVRARNLALRIVGHLRWLQRPIVERVTGLTE
jgi:2-polyprenyl-6-methoxyphenol hydroxylase-like FAD-dependent oxidoreductase